jgi:hypothetical protein
MDSVNRNGPQVLAILGQVAWLGGLLRLVGEVATRLQAAILPNGLDGLAWLSLGVTAVIFAVFFRVSFPWYQRLFRQQRADLAVTYGVPVAALPSFWSSVRQQARPLTAIAVGALVVALLLPGMVAAAAAIAIGLTVRVTAAALGPSGDIQRR